MKPYIIPTFQYPPDYDKSTYLLTGEDITTEEMVVADTVFYNIAYIDIYPYEGDGRYTSITSGAHSILSPLSIDKIRAIIER